MASFAFMSPLKATNPMSPVKFLLIPSLALITLFTTGCGRESKTVKDTPTTGKIKIGVDEIFEPLVNEEIKTFQALYPEAEIEVIYKPVDEISAGFIGEETKLMIIPRKLNEKEVEYFNKIGMRPDQTPLALDGVAFVVNRANPDSLISFETLGKILSGNISTWKGVNLSSPLD